MKKYNYRYVRFKTPQGIGYSLFKIEWEKTGRTLSYRVAGAFCSPKDTFLKPQAREIVDARLALKPTKSICGFLHDADLTWAVSNNDFARMLPDILDDLEYAPGWARRAESKNKIRFGLSVPSKPPRSKQR